MRIVVSTNREVSAHPLGISILTVDEHGKVLDALPTGWGQVDSLIIGLTILHNARKWNIDLSDKKLIHVVGGGFDGVVGYHTERGNIRVMYDPKHGSEGRIISPIIHEIVDFPAASTKEE